LSNEVDNMSRDQISLARHLNEVRSDNETVRREVEAMGQIVMKLKVAVERDLGKVWDFESVLREFK
jgi:hypothetical protein